MSKTGGLSELLLLASERKLQKDYQGALALYHEATEEVGDNAGVFVAIALCHYMITAIPGETHRKDHEKEAVYWMKRAIDLAPNHAHWHYLLGEIYQIVGSDDKSALQEYRQAIELNPYDAQVLFNSAGLHGPPEDPVSLEEAIGWVERAVQLAPRNADYHFRLGELYHEAGRFAEAQKLWLEILLWTSGLSHEYVARVRKALAPEENL
jgi:tetratricopeptide (TPR) repeat protein